MKKILFSAAAIALVSSAPALAQSGTGPEYYGSLGYSHSSIDSSDVDLGAITARLGARFNPYFGVEGEASVGVNDDSVTVAGVTVDVEHRYDAALYAVGFVPVSENLDLFARVGYGTTEVRASGAGLTVTEDGESWNYGVGAQYTFDGQNGVRGDWTRRDFRDGGEADVWSLSYVRRF